MKRLITLLLLTVMLTGCATIQSWIPSFWDDNQSARIVDVRLGIDRLNCAGDQLAQITRIRDDLRWFELYSQSKGALQKDVIALIAPMQATVEDMYTRTSKGQASATYCELKRTVMQQQAQRAAAGILGRW
jgi:hypothetical protein